MTSSKEIKCPECSAVVKIDDANHASIVNQVRDKLFEEQLNKRVSSEVNNAVKDKVNQLKLVHQEEINAKNSIIKEHEQIQSSFEKDKKIAIADALEKIKEEKDKILGERIELEKSLDYTRKEYQEEVKRIKENKLKLSTKMVGESLEESVLIEYDKYIRRLLPYATFEKDNDNSAGTKGDYIFRDYDSQGNEIISIMFELKNEEEGSINKQTNKQHFKKLDKDRRLKNCEYAVLISNLEQDDERYNNGFTTVYHEYPKMIVARPNCFISTIYTLRELGIELLELKRLLEEEQSKTIDITNFKKGLESLQEYISKYLEYIFNNINSIIKKQDRIIKEANDSKEVLLNALTSNSKKLDKKLQGISVEKLIKNNSTMTLMFKNLENSNQEIEQEELGSNLLIGKEG